MQHRHINTTEWTKEAIDSALERGNLPDWQDLFRSAKEDSKLAKDILEIAKRHDEDGTFAIAENLIKKTHPELFASEITNK